MKSNFLNYKIIVFSIMFSITSYSNAENRLNKTSLNNGYLLNYRWIDSQNNESKINIFFKSESLINHKVFEVGKQHSFKIKQIENEINKSASLGVFSYKLDDNLNLSVSFPKKYENTIEQKNSMIIAKSIIDKNKSKVSNDITFDGFRILNYEKLVNESKDQTMPISKAFVGKHTKSSDRDMLSDIISFYQSIPYSTLDKNSIGFINTNEMISTNVGDCDSKSVSFMAGFKNIYPKKSAIIILINKHALVGFEIEPEENDKTISFNGRVYVLAEPVGPAIMGIGRISKYSELEISKRRFKIILI